MSYAGCWSTLAERTPPTSAVTSPKHLPDVSPGETASSDGTSSDPLLCRPPDPSFLAVYGSLRRRSLAKQRFFVLQELQFYGYGVLRGLLLIQNGYPAVLEQSGLVRVEIFRLGGGGVWQALDRYEGYQPNLGYRSLFYRKEVSLLRPQIRAWVYFLGREIPRGRQKVLPQVSKDFYFQAWRRARFGSILAEGRRGQINPKTEGKSYIGGSAASISAFRIKNYGDSLCDSNKRRERTGE